MNVASDKGPWPYIKGGAKRGSREEVLPRGEGGGGDPDRRRGRGGGRKNTLKTNQTLKQREVEGHVITILPVRDHSRVTCRRDLRQPYRGEVIILSLLNASR